MNVEWLGKNNKAIAPLRVSSYGQKDNTSRVTQERDIRAYCADKGLELVDLVPIVETARKSELRKKYAQVIQRSLKEQIKHIVFHKYDREARNLTDNEFNENLVREGKVVLHYVTDQKVLHQHSPDSDFLMRNYHAVQNKHYSRDLSTKVRAATKTKAEHGWYPGTHTPLGYVHEKLRDANGREFRRGSIIIKDPNERLIKQVYREFELRASRPTPSLYQIRRQIIEEGYIPPNEIKAYHVGTIDRRLKNIFYDKRFIWQGIEYQGHHERIVPAELFWKVQETFGAKNPYRKNEDALFGNGWISCADPSCGCNIVYDPVKKTIKATGEVKVFKYYHCTNGKKVHLSLQGMRITEEALMEQFTPAIKQISIREDFRDELLNALNQNQEKARRAIKRDIENYQIALNGLEKREDDIYEDLRAGILDEAGYRRQVQKVREDRDNVEKAASFL